MSSNVKSVQAKPGKERVPRQRRQSLGTRKSLGSPGN
jgi:hypothetical protein